jgi:hypothetical protein
MSMTNEERKEYNKKYYAENKERIAEMLLTKQECPHCKKFITKGNMQCHMKSKLCTKRRGLLNQQVNVDITDLQKQIEELKLMIITSSHLPSSEDEKAV